MREGYQGQQLGADIQRFNFLQNQPQQNLQNYMSLVYGNPLGRVGSTTASGAADTSTLQKVLGTAATGAEFYAMFFFIGTIICFGYVLEIQFIEKGIEAYGIGMKSPRKRNVPSKGKEPVQIKKIDLPLLADPANWNLFGLDPNKGLGGDEDFGLSLVASRNAKHDVVGRHVSAGGAAVPDRQQKLPPQRRLPNPNPCYASVTLDSFQSLTRSGTLSPAV